MGLITGLLTLPLAPARGLTWVVRQVVEEAEAQHADPRRIRRELARAEASLAAGEIDERGFEQIERELLGRLEAG